MDTVRDSGGRVFVDSCIAASAAVTAIAGTTTAAYFIYQGIRDTRIENILDASYRIIAKTLSFVFTIDPVVAAWAIPLALGSLAVIGMLIYRHYKS